MVKPSNSGFKKNIDKPKDVPYLNSYYDFPMTILRSFNSYTDYT